MAWMAMGNWLEQAFNFLIFVLLARLLGAEIFGYVAMAAAVVILCEFLVRESLTEYLISAETENQGHTDAVFWCLMGLGVGLYLALVAAAGMISQFYGQPAVKSIIQVLALSVLFVALGAVPASLLRRRMRFRSLAVRAVAGVLAGGLVAIWMALNGYGVWSLVGQRIVQVLVNTVLAWFAVSWRPHLRASWPHVREIMGMGRTVLLLRGAQIARIQIPMALIGALLGPVALGLFSLAWRLVEIASFLVSTPMRMVSQSAFATQLRRGQSGGPMLVEISRLSGWIALPALLGLSVLAEPIVMLMFGEAWLGAAPILTIIALVGAYQAIEMIHQSYCLAAGRVVELTWVAWTEVIIAAGLVGWAAGYGLEAVSWAFVASFVLLWVVRFHIVSRVADLPLMTLPAQHLFPVLASLVMAVSVNRVLAWTGMSSSFAVLFVGAVIGMAIYLALTSIFMRSRLELAGHYLLSRPPSTGEEAS